MTELHGLEIPIWWQERMGRVDWDGVDKNTLKRAIEKFESMERDNPFHEFELTIETEPQPKGRPRIGRGRFYDPSEKHTKALGKKTKEILGADFTPIGGEVEYFATFFIPMIGFSKTDRLLAELGYIRPDKRPDIDNYVKLTLDSVNGYLYADDGQVVLIGAEEFYSERPRIELKIRYRKERLTKK